MPVAGVTRRSHAVPSWCCTPMSTSEGGRRHIAILKIGCIEIILACNAHEREQGIAPRVGQGGAHAARARDIADGANWPVRSNPLSRGVGECGGEVYDARGLVECRGLDGGD